MYIVNILFSPINQTTYFLISNIFKSAKISSFIQFHYIFYIFIAHKSSS